MRAVSKNDLCDIVVKAWNSISTEIIKKSFDCCGQSKESVPEQVTCIKKGKLAEEAFEKVKDFFPPVAMRLVIESGLYCIDLTIWCGL